MLWVGFALSLVAFTSYFFLFVQFPSTRNFPSVNLALFALAGGLLTMGLRRAFRHSEMYHGKVFGSFRRSERVGRRAFYLFGFCRRPADARVFCCPARGHQGARFHVARYRQEPDVVGIL